MKLVIYILLFAFTNISSIGVFHHHRIDYYSKSKLTNSESLIDCKLCELLLIFYYISRAYFSTIK